MGEKIVYEAEITGNSAPYKWIAYAKQFNSRPKVAEGESDTFEHACQAASKAAFEVESQRSHSATRETVFLFDAELYPTKKTDVRELEAMVDG